MANKVRRIGVLFSRLSGYMAACLKVLKERHDVELLVFRRPPAQEAPFEERHFTWIDHLYDRTKFRPDEIMTIVEQFNPDAVFMVGWVDRGYLHVARTLRRHKVTVVAGSDAQWESSFKQHVGRLIAPWYLHSAIDVLWAAGERQRQFAGKLGYSGECCWSGYYACDWTRFANVYRRGNDGRSRAFLFIGRYVAVKGIEVLVDAYQQYRAMVGAPWPLICVGAGEQQTLLQNIEGIQDKGFVQPDLLPEMMAQASAFVLPSKREPWGVVVQEAAAAGLPLLCSDACGAAVHLLQDRYNGFLFEAGNARHLARCMASMTEASSESWQAMSLHSHELSKQYTPERWADTLVQGIEMVRT